MIRASNIDEYSATAAMINDIVERVNTGHCADYSKADFIVSYPAALYLQGTAGKVAIYKLDAITDTGNGYRIDYTDMDRHTAEQTKKTLCLTFQ